MLFFTFLFCQLPFCIIFASFAICFFALLRSHRFIAGFLCRTFLFSARLVILFEIFLFSSKAAFFRTILSIPDAGKCLFAVLANLIFRNNSFSLSNNTPGDRVIALFRHCGTSLFSDCFRSSTFLTCWTVLLLSTKDNILFPASRALIRASKRSSCADSPVNCFMQPICCILTFFTACALCRTCYNFSAVRASKRMHHIRVATLSTSSDELATFLTYFVAPLAAVNPSLIRYLATTYWAYLSGFPLFHVCQQKHLV